MKRSLLILLLTVGFGVPSFGGQAFKEAIPYINSFVLVGRAMGIETGMLIDKLTMTFVDVLPDRIIGLCYPDPQGAIIFIRKGYWDLADGVHREQLIWHEMGHCILGKEHNDTVRKGHPVSIMYPDNRVVEDEGWYISHKMGYIRELFTLTH